MGKVTNWVKLFIEGSNSSYYGQQMFVVSSSNIIMLVASSFMNLFKEGVIITLWVQKFRNCVFWENTGTTKILLHSFSISKYILLSHEVFICILVNSYKNRNKKKSIILSVIFQSIIDFTRIDNTNTDTRSGQMSNDWWWCFLFPHFPWGFLLAVQHVSTSSLRIRMLVQKVFHPIVEVY